MPTSPDMSSFPRSLFRPRHDMTATELHFITVAEAARRIARRELSPVELTEAYLQRIDAFDDQLQSLVTLTADRARQQAKTAETEDSQGPVRRCGCDTTSANNYQFISPADAFFDRRLTLL